MRTELSARYRIERELGRGGNATVYLAEDATHGRPVAVKVLHPELVEAVGGQRFLREIAVAASLHHPNLLEIHDSGESGGVFYYVTPYLEDGSLRARLEREKQLPIDEAVRITTQVAAALAHVHARGVVHRDVKPENILFAGSHAYIADFGIARAIDTAAGDTLTSTGLVVGTPAYMSPEQASGERVVDARSDQYSLACVLYEMISGMPPFIGPTAQSVIAQRFAHAALPLSHYRPGVPAHIERAVAKALSLSPADRFGSISDFMTAITVAPAESSATLTVTGAHRIKRRWFALGATAALAIVAVVGFRQAYTAVIGARRPAVDTTKWAVLPLNSSAPRLTGIRAAEVVHDGLNEWNGLVVVDEFAARDAAARRPLRTLNDAFSAATALGAGRLVWGHAADAGGRAEVRLVLYDVANRAALRTLAPITVGYDSAPAVLRAAATRLLRGSDFPRGASSGEFGTRSFAARRAYERGHAAVEAGEFARAHAEFVSAASEDPDYAHAHLWSSLVGAFSREDGWHGSARLAYANRSPLLPREQSLAEALVALADNRHPDACAAFERAARADSLDFVAWYGGGECRVMDSLVVRSSVSPSGWAFRAGSHTAVQSYRRSLALNPGAYGLPVFQVLRRTLRTQTGMLRRGRDAAGRQFAAYPQLVNDTLGFVPFQTGERAVGARVTDEEAHAAALRRNSDVLLAIAREWIARRPREAAAHEALANVLEVRGEIHDGRGGTSALQAVRAARRLATSPAEKVTLGVSEVRVLVKRGQFSEAASLADSLLRQTDPGGGDSSAAAPLAAMLGRPSLVARLDAPHITRRYAPRVPPAVRDRWSVLHAHSIAGACASVQRLHDQLRAAIETNMAPRDVPRTWTSVAEASALAAAPCPGLRTPLWVETDNPHLRAYRALYAGRPAEARRLADTIAAMRAKFRPGDVSLDYVLHDANVFVAVGDTTRAIRSLHLALSALANQRVSLLEMPEQAAALPRAMALLAELAAARGDRRSARHWAERCSSLLRGADASLAPLSSRMRELSRG